jgi:N-acyl-D-amino-acid deacylase
MAAVLASALPAFAAEPGIPATGKTGPDFASFDDMMLDFMKTNPGVPGAALAVARDGKLIYSRGFGYADRERKEPVQPQSLFRIASLTKPFTAVAVLQLIERGKLKFEDRVFDVLQLQVADDTQMKFDERWRKITIRQLLQHTAGWDRDRKGGFDPMFISAEVVQALEVKPPADQGAIIRYMLRKPLDYEPGTKVVYSNFGYCLLGRVIEKVSGQKYEDYVRKEVQEPLGIRSMRLGKTLLADRAPGEVKYYEYEKYTAVMGPDLGKPVAAPYGGFCLEALDSHGGWLASAEDLVLFAAAFNQPDRCKILKRSSIEEMFACPEGPIGHEPDGKMKESFYACGWYVTQDPAPTRLNTWHTGRLDGTSTLLVRRWDNMIWAVLFNSHDGTKVGKDITEPCSVIDPLVHRAANAYLTRVKK